MRGICVCWFPVLGVAAWFGCLGSVSAAEGTLTITSGQNRSNVSIVVPNEAGAPLLFAAAELQKYLEQMVGARLEIRRGALPGCCILLSAVTAAERARERMGDNLAAEPDSFRITVSDGVVELTGGQERAVVFAVYAFLERLGCRWFGPREEHVPKWERLVIPPMTVRETPTLRWRGLELIAGVNGAVVDWMAKARLNAAWPEQYVPNQDLGCSEQSMKNNAVLEMSRRGLSIFWGGHILTTLIPVGKYRDHPEYFALLKGKRLNPDLDAQDQNQLCVSNPEALRVLSENTVRFLREHPWLEVLFLWGGDTSSWCECENCMTLLPDRNAQTSFGPDRAALYARMVKAVSESVSKALPGRKIAFNHYYNLENLPTDRTGRVLRELLPAPDVLSAVDDYHQCVRHPFSDAACPGGKRIEPIARMWNPHYRESLSWSYYFAWNFMKGLPVSLVHKMPEDFRFARGLGISGVVDNVTLGPNTLHWQNNVINFYLYAKAAWNPALDVDGTLDDFLRSYYGPAAKEMGEVWRGLEESGRKFGSDPAFQPEDARLADRKVIHGRMRDFADTQPGPHGNASAHDIRYLIPNGKVFERIMRPLRSAEEAVSASPDPAQRLRVKALRAVVAGWKGEPEYAGFGFMNGGGNLTDMLFETEGDRTTCTLFHAGNTGNCFWTRPLGTPQLEQPGDAVQVRVRLNVPSRDAGAVLYRSGPGLFQADNQSAQAGAAGARSVMLFISNVNNDDRGRRRVILNVNDRRYGTDLKSSDDDAWDYRRPADLRIVYVSGQPGQHTYQYLYRTGDTWKEVGQLVFPERLCFVAPYFHASMESGDVNRPLADWALFEGFVVTGKAIPPRPRW
jgi:hypothetical protein